MKKSSGFKVTVQITNHSPDHIGEICYLTGNFNRWQENGIAIGTIPEVGEIFSYELQNVPEGMLDLKVHRGNWASSACDRSGRLGVPNSAHISSDSRIALSIDAWRDDFAKSTASPQVHILDNKFYFPKINIHRRVWIYLPEDYHASSRSYPVLYMFDGQHLFDEATAPGRMGPIEWCVDEVIDQSADKAIVVAIDHASDFKQREKEYLVNPIEDHPSVYGRQLLDDIVSELKPYVDAHYRTKSAREYTALLGSSLAGLLSLYGALLYPDVFASVGVFSPSIWIDRERLYSWLEQQEKRSGELPKQDFYLYCGGMEIKRLPGGEAANMATDLDLLNQRLSRFSSIRLIKSSQPEARHGALYWQGEFPKFYAWWHHHMER